jgi:hypothetical protein
MFDPATLRFLHGLVTTRIRHNERALARLTAKGDQTAADVETIREEWTQNLAWQRGVRDRIEQAMTDR